MKTTRTAALDLTSARRPGALHLVSVHEVENLRAALAAGITPLDLERKLATLILDDPVKHDVHQKTRLCLALLSAVRDGSFPSVPAEHQERLLRVVAYVRKTDDAVTDLRADGYRDDLAEVRAAFQDLAELFERFKHWRLRHQVPVLWSHAA